MTSQLIRTDLADPVGYTNDATCFDELLSQAITRNEGTRGEPAESAASPPSSQRPCALILAHNDHLLSMPINATATRFLSDWRLVIFLGVNHCIKGLSDTFLFDSFDAWRGLSGGDGKAAIPVATDLRTEVMKALGPDMAVRHDEYHAKEHSIEALIPVVSRFSPGAAILPIGVPRCDKRSAAAHAEALADALGPALASHGLTLGVDAVFVLSNDCCHYGSAFQFTPHGTDEAGFRRQVAVEGRVCDTLVGTVTKEKIEEFLSMVNKPERSERDSLWCGTFPVAVGLLALLRLSEKGSIRGEVLAHSNSIDCPPLSCSRPPPPGLTCPPPSYDHWVGHLAAAYFPIKKMDCPGTL